MPAVDTLDLSAINSECDQLSTEWNSSKTKKDLTTYVGSDILTQKELSLNAALCLGLGTMGASSEAGSDKSLLAGERNTSLNQLLAFETVLECLRGKYLLVFFYGAY
jgi:hypothetical protein